jgi:hypothetical protein
LQFGVESTADGLLFPENALAGAIPTEIGQLAQLERLDIDNNQLTGTLQQTSLIAKWYSSCPTSKKDLLAAQAKFRRNSASARHCGGSIWSTTT